MYAVNPTTHIVGDLAQAQLNDVSARSDTAIDALNQRLNNLRDMLGYHYERLWALGDRLFGANTSGEAGRPKEVRNGHIAELHEKLDDIEMLITRIGDAASRLDTLA